MRPRSWRRGTPPAGPRLPRLGPVALLAAALLVTTGPGMTASHMPTVPRAVSGAAVLDSDPVGSLAASLDYDVDAMFRYVADDIRYEPYTGILRGPAGTLAAGAGNSVDKSLLLAALLDAGQVRYRFAEGPLDATATARIVDALATDTATARQDALGPLVAGTDQLAPATSPVPGSSDAPAAQEQDANTIADQGAQRFQVARSRLHDTVTMLTDALTNAGVSLRLDDAVSLPSAETTGHTWVQVANGPSWKDLDPTLPTAQPGSTLAKPSTTLDRLPDDLRYRVTFDVLVEHAQGGQLVTQNVLSDEEFADALAGVPVTFGHVTPSWLKRLGVSLNALLGDGWLEYRPTIGIGTRTIVGDGTAAFPIAGGTTDIFGAASSPGAGPLDGEATAEWLEVTVTAPGSQPQTVRRTVFDRVPAAVRYAGTPTAASVGPVTLVDLDGSGATDFPPMRGVKAFAIATGPTSAAQTLTVSDDGLDMLASVYHHLRDALDAEIALDDGARTFADGPDIVSVSVDVAPDATSSDVRDHVRLGFDIWRRSDGVLPLTGASMAAPEAALVAGVTDHIAERFALEALADQTSAPVREISVGAVFETAAAQGIPTVVLHGQVPTSLPYGPSATAAIEAALERGEVVVIPARPVTLDGAPRTGWWTIDPGTGSTADSMDDGSGAAAAEYETTVQTRLGQIKCYGALGATIAYELAWVVNVQLTHLASLNTFSQLRHYRQAGVCA